MQYQYRALINGKIVSKQIEANSEQDVLGYLRKNDYLPIEIKKIEKGISILNSLTDKVSFTDVVDFTRQIAIMLNAGLTIIDCLNILQQQLTKPSLIALVSDINKEIMSGNTFSSALKKYPQYFPNLYISLVKSGEASGKLNEILLKLAENLEKQREFQSKIKGALIYPIVILIGMLAVVFIMITFVLPKLLSLYKDFNVELPLSTVILMAVSTFSAKFWPFIIIAVFGIVTLVQKYLKTSKGKLLYDTLILKVPMINKVITIAALVDATRTLGILTASGVSILDGLDIIVETTSNMVYQNAFKNIYKLVEKGFSLGKAMESQAVFPPILVQMTSVGEQTGHLDDTLTRISRYFESESELAVKTLTTLIEPLILVLLGVGVGFLVMSVITPIYNLTTSFK